MMRRGVYFLANDKVYDLAIAFLNSFRLYNKNIELCLIPFDENYKQIENLKDQYNFFVYENTEVLHSCDQISAHFHEKKLGAYRKIAAWEGVFDEFVYIDIDTVLIDNIDFVFNKLEQFPLFTSHSNSPGLIKWVWKESIYKKNMLTEEQIAFSANTGFIVSKRMVLSVNVAMEKAASCLNLKSDMVLFCMEQPFLNYLIVTSEIEYSSLLVMYKKKYYSDIKLECWAGIEDGIVHDGKLYSPRGEPFFIVHWAGLWQDNADNLKNVPYNELWLHYRNLNPEHVYKINN